MNPLRLPIRGAADGSPVGEPCMSGKKQPLSREFWRPDEPKAWVRKQPRWGQGWTVNWAAVTRRLWARGRADRGSSIPEPAGVRSRGRRHREPTRRV